MNKLTKYTIGIFCASALIGTPLLVTAQPNQPEIKISYAPKLEREYATNYGAREKEVIEETLRREVANRLDGNVSRVEIEVLEATPNRPTFKQMGDKMGLSYESISLGGAAFNGKAYDNAGNLVHQTTYRSGANNIFDSIHAWTWSDADNAARTFVTRLANSQ